MALIAILSSLAIPYWQAQQYPAKRQLAWLQLQQLLLAEAEYRSQTGAYTADIGRLALVDDQLGYDYQIQLEEGGLWLQALVRTSGPQAGDEGCWQLWLHEDGIKQAYDRQGQQSFVCD